MFSGLVGYRWTSIDTLHEGDGNVVTVGGNTVDVDLNGPVALVQLTLFLKNHESSEE